MFGWLNFRDSGTANGISEPEPEGSTTWSQNKLQTRGSMQKAQVCCGPQCNVC